MYNSLPWEEDITRVYMLKPVGFSCSEGILLFPLKKGDIWCIVDAKGVSLCASLCVWLCIVDANRKRVRTKCNTEAERERRERERSEGHTVNVKHLAHAALYLQAGKIQSSVCEYNRVLAFPSSDVCTQTLKLQKAFWKQG